jgi:hypothetical protein
MQSVVATSARKSNAVEQKQRHEITHGTNSNNFLDFKFLAEMELITRKLNKDSNVLKEEYTESNSLTDAVNTILVLINICKEFAICRKTQVTSHTVNWEGYSFIIPNSKVRNS